MAENIEHKIDRDPSAGSVVERLAEKLGMKAGAKTVYADPVERDGVTVIPVARVRWGFGGGGGWGKREGSGGSGGGGGVQVSPVGYIELRDGVSQFRPIRDPAAMVPLLVASGVVGWMILRGLQRLIRS